MKEPREATQTVLTPQRVVKKPWYTSAERGPLVMAWLLLASVWVLAFAASRTPVPAQAQSHMLKNLTDVTVLISFVQFFTGILYLFLYPHIVLRKRLLICTALFFSLAVIVATKQGVVLPRYHTEPLMKTSYARD